MWWLTLLVLIALYIFYLYRCTNTYSSPIATTYSSNENLYYQKAGGMILPRKYLIYANGNTIDPNNTIAIITTKEEEMPTLEYIKNEYNILRTRSEIMELNDHELERLKALQGMVKLLQNDMIIAYETNTVPQLPAKLGVQIGGTIIDNRMGSDVLTGMSSGPPISPALGPLPGAPIAEQILQLGVIKDSIANMLKTAYRVPETVGFQTPNNSDTSNTSNTSTNASNTSNTNTNANNISNTSGDTSSSLVDIAHKLRDGIHEFYNIILKNSEDYKTIIDFSKKLSSMSQLLESKLNAENNKLYQAQAQITAGLRAFDSVDNNINIANLSNQIAQSQQEVYLALGGVIPSPYVSKTLPEQPTNDAKDKVAEELRKEVAVKEVAVKEVAKELERQDLMKKELEAKKVKDQVGKDQVEKDLSGQQVGKYLSEGDKQSLLNQHNNWRSKYNSPPLTWDNTLTEVAQDWANQMAASGNFAHRQNGKYGENLWMGTAGAFPINSSVDSWGDEVNDYNIANNTCASGKVCGHFTQLVWSNTARVGCGKATGKDGNDYIACNYDPPGNFVGESPFMLSK